MTIRRGALKCSAEEYREVEWYMKTKVLPSPPKFGNPTLRKEATFGDNKYANYQLVVNRGEWPTVVKRALAHARLTCVEMAVPDPEKFTAVHANFYENGKAGVSRHSDDEPQMVAGAPILSYTFLDPEGVGEGARDFVIYKKPNAEGIEGKGKVATVRLQDGDLLVMGGEMQKHFFHELPRCDSMVGRVNLTVRRYNPHPRTGRRGGRTDIHMSRPPMRPNAEACREMREEERKRRREEGEEESEGDAEA